VPETRPSKAATPRRPTIQTTKKPPEDIDFDDPIQRFEINSFARVDGKIHAIVIDWSTNQHVNVAEGSTLAEYKVGYLDMARKTIQLVGPNMSTTLLKRKR
jgi:hypothetical protein